MVTETDLILKILARGATPAQAFGLVANFIQESGLDPGINEANPTVPGSRGGFGLAQFTGPRRVAFEKFARERGAPLDDVDAQLDFIFNTEFPTTERRAANSFFTAKTPEEAALAISRDFLRPGIPNNERRLAEARRLADEFGNATNEFGDTSNNQLDVPQDEPAGQNSFRANLLDVKDFQTAPNAFAPNLELGTANFLTRRIRNGS